MFGFALIAWPRCLLHTHDGNLLKKTVALLAGLLSDLCTACDQNDPVQPCRQQASSGLKESYSGKERKNGSRTCSVDTNHLSVTCTSSPICVELELLGWGESTQAGCYLGPSQAWFSVITQAELPESLEAVERFREFALLWQR